MNLGDIDRDDDEIERDEQPEPRNMSTTPKPRRPRTENESFALSSLSRCTFPVASWDKRFLRSLNSCVTISDAEIPQLWRLVIKYRRQHRNPNLLRIAAPLAAPDLRKLAAMKKAQARIDQMKADYEAAMKK